MMRLILLASTFIFYAHAHANNSSLPFEIESTFMEEHDFDESSLEDQKNYFTSLEDICELFQLPEENCTCELLSSLSSSNSSIDICAITQTLNVTRRKLEYSRTYSSVYASVTIIASLIGGFGNFGILIVAYKQRKGLPRSNILFAQLAIVDFVFSVVQIIVVVPLFWTNRWVFGAFLCKLLRAAMVMGGLLTIGFILNITIERFLGIIYPLKTKRTSKKTMFCLTISNIIAGFLTIIPLLAVLRLDNETGRCREHWNDFSANPVVYSWFLLIVYFLLPVIAIFILYGRIISHLKQQEKINKLLYIESERQKKLKRNQRIMYIIVSILIAFIVCILPNRAIWIYFEYRNYQMDKQLYIILTYISYLTYPFHVAFNPIIYSMIDDKWRRDIVNVFFCRHIGHYRMSKTSTATINTSSISSQDLRIATRAKLSIISEKDWESKTHLMVYRVEQMNKEECTAM